MEPPSKSSKKLDDYYAIGFDIDHCLVRYNVKNLVPIMHEAFCRILIDKHQYPSEINELTEEHLMFIQNALIIDVKTEYVIKLAKDKKILKAYHGFEKVDRKYVKFLLYIFSNQYLLSPEKLIHYYGDDCCFHDFIPDKPRTERYVLCVTFFEVMAPLIFSKIIHIKKSSSGVLIKKDAHQILHDIIDSIASNYMHYSSNEYYSIMKYGFYFPEAIKNIDKVIYKQEKMLEILRKLKDKGKVLFLITNSHVEYAELLLNHAFGEFQTIAMTKEWRKLFAILCSKAGKPGFFTDEKRIFLRYNPESHNRIGESLELLEYEKHHIVLEGNSKGLEDMLKYAAQRDGRILYFGDNYVTDCLASQKNANWDAICIMEELKGVDFGVGTSNAIWGDYFRNDDEDGKAFENFWYDYLKDRLLKIVSRCDCDSLDEFYE